MLKPESLKAKPADNYEDLKKQFFALKNLCELKIKQCSIYSNKLAEYDRESLIARNEALESEKEMNAQLTEELAKADERVKELEEELATKELLHVGFTNGSQIKYAKVEEGSFYPNTDGNCYIPLYMLKSHEHRIETTSIEQLRKEQE